MVGVLRTVMAATSTSPATAATGREMSRLLAPVLVPAAAARKAIPLPGALTVRLTVAVVEKSVPSETR